jgi:hypothetical protein
LKLKSNDRILGDYFERIAVSIVKEVGQKESKYKLDDEKFMGADFDSVDA